MEKRKAKINKKIVIKSGKVVYNKNKERRMKFEILD